MTASWDSLRPGAARPQRIRGGEIPTPHATSWREQQRQARAHIAAQRKAATADPSADQPSFGFHIGRLWVDGDALFAFCLFVPMVFMVQFATLGAAIIAGLTPLYLFFRRKHLGRLLAPRLFFYAFPAFALFSVVWSEVPKETLKFALELAVTITAALLLASARNQRAVIKAIALAFLIYVADAVLTGGRVAVGVGAGGQAFSGLTDSKNLMADIASTGLLVSLAVIIISVRTGDVVWIVLCSVAALLHLYAVFGARSAGAILGLALGLMPLLVLTPLISAGRMLRAWLTTTVAMSLFVIGLNYRVIAQFMINLAADVFDKDPTLTGRTYLWYRAFGLIRERPILGRGYFSFWLQGNLDAEGLWQYAGIRERSGFNFHNTLVDLVVTIGWLGAAVVVVILLIGGFALVRRFIERPSLALVFWISLLLYELSRMPIETLGIQPFAYTTTLLFTALALAFGRSHKPRVAHRPIRSAVAVPVQIRAVDYGGGAWANPRLAPAKGSLRLKRKQEVEG